MKTSKSDIERVLWRACDSFRGKIDSSRYKDYILSMLFVNILAMFAVKPEKSLWNVMMAIFKELRGQ